MKDATPARTQVQLLDADSLDLDPENPRLPEEFKGRSQEAILTYLFDNLVLDELAQSFVDNGFFPHEPLIVTPGPSKGRSVVLEGNRRLAALMVLHGRPEAEGRRFDVEAPRGSLDRLREIPCYSVGSREDVFRYLGFRHIGGIKTWGAEAKARYLTTEVDKAVKKGSKNPFQEVGRDIGSNAQGVRNPYIALAILRYARDEFGIDVSVLQNQRFGVWLRALNARAIRQYVGLGDARSYEEVAGALRGLVKANLERVVSDLTPSGRTEKALVEDSRDLTDYGRILEHKRAAAVLMKHRDFDLAKQIVNETDLPERINRIAEQCDLILQELQTIDATDALSQAADRLIKVARMINAMVKELSKEQS